MSEVKKSYVCLKNDFLFEMDYISNLGRNMFIFPFIGRSKLSTLCFYFTYGLLFVTLAQLFVSLCMTGFSDWFKIVNIAPNLGVSLMIFLKYTKIHNNKDLYDQVFKHFQRDLWETVNDSLKHKEILKQYTQTTKLIVRSSFYYTIGLAMIVVLFPWIIMVYENDIIGKEKQYLYPFDGWYPFDKTRWYYAVYMWESFMTTVVIFIYVFVNMLHVSYTRYICMEVKILGISVEEFINNDDVIKIKGKKSVDSTYFDISHKLKFIITKHQFLAKITSELDEVLGDGMLMTYIFGSVFICLTAFTASVSHDLYKSLRYFSFFCSLLVEVFIQCIMGQLLIDHSEKLEKSIYSSDWVYADSDTKKMIILFLIRAQKPFKFSAKGYLTMNLDTFSGICSLSYQFFNLLRTAYSK